eukprot:scaffold1007_cov176-Amphora_coffeaeformis.AAC.29
MDSSSNHSTSAAAAGVTRRSSSTGSNKEAVANAAPPAGAATSSAATASLQLLLREDPLLQQYGLTDSTKTADQVAFQYAATLLQTDSTSSTSRTAAAQQALQDVERKLALVESLAVKLSRTSPEAVAGPFLRWHGYYVNPMEQQQQQQSSAGGETATSSAITTTTTTNNNTLSSVRDRADRLERQSEVLQGVAKRVEGSLQRGLDRMSTACLRLERVLELSQTLKRLLRFHFEWRKVQNYDLDDTRDLTRAAASVAVLEDLLTQPEWHGGAAVQALQHWKPAAEQMARAVRHAAAQLLQQQCNSTTDGHHNPTMSPYHLSATLQVYFSLQELPAAVWQAVDQQHALAEAATRELWSPQRLQQFTEQARRGGGSIPSGGSSSKDPRSITKRLQQVRLEAAESWAAAVTAAAMQVQQLQRVLQYKTDPTTRRGFYQVVAVAPVPPSYAVDGSKASPTSTSNFSLFGLFWKRYCRTLGQILEQILTTDTAAADALYPAVRGVAKDMIGRFQEVATSTTTTSVEEGARKTGILGGPLQDWGVSSTPTTGGNSDNPQAAPDSWTRGEKTLSSTTNASSTGNSSKLLGSAASLAIFQSSEWNDLQGTDKHPHGLYRLQQAFVEACTARLCEPLQYLFPENITLDDHGVPMSGGALSLLPSKYDIQRFDDNIRQELSLADPREGGGDLSSVTMICACVVDMMQQFCHRAQQALSGSNQYITSDWNMTESLHHDRKVAIILYTISNHLKAAPEKTFVSPYRPASLPAHEEAATLCEGALQPALTTIDNMVQTNILGKLAASLNQRLATLLAKMHLGVYLGRSEDESSTFCQRQISPALDTIAERIMTRFPPPFATYLASSVTSFLIYTFCSNMALLRPLGEASRLHITQDLADLELALEQFMSKTAATSLSQVGKGKPYAELRAVRQMLFWNGLSSAGKSGNDLSRMLLREAWIRSMRPSTVLHYLFSYAPSLLTSPHHARRVKAEEYAQALVSWEGEPDSDGEETAWMNTLTCCDSYQQRSGTAAASEDGDARVAALLIALGPELLRRRRK